MLCQVCQKNSAKLHITQVRGDNLLELHVCPACAAEHGLVKGEVQADTSLKNMLSQMLDDEQAAPIDDRSELRICPTCSQTFRGFRESGRLGCQDCYEAFSAELDDILRRMQAGVLHKGKVPPQRRSEPNPYILIQQKREQLRHAVADEDFSIAAKLRDEIHELEEITGI